MYCKTGMFCDTNQRINSKYLIQSKSEKTPKSKLTGKNLPKGYLKNMYIAQKDDGVSIKGSLAKYYFGNNIEVLTRKDTEMAIEKISDEIKVNIKNGRVNSLEIGMNIGLINPYNDYLEYFGDFKNNYLIKSKFANTIYYSNKQKKIRIYNKLPEIKNSKQAIPEAFKDCDFDVMRIELELKKRINKEFGMNPYVYSLYDEGFYMKAIDKLIEYYFKINKTSKVIMNPEKYLTPKDYINYLIIELIQSKGLDSVLNDIDNKRHRFNNSGQASNCKRMIKGYFEKDIVLQDKDLINEIDNKVLLFKNYR